jgi:hypothetical protein
MKNSISIREVIVNATDDVLNAAVTEYQIEPDKIISVIFQPRRELAIGDYKAKYRLITAPDRAKSAAASNCLGGSKSAS